MRTPPYPAVLESQGAATVSDEAILVRTNMEACHVLFTGRSLFVQGLHKQQLKKRFDFYNSIWKSETIFSSSITEITNNSAYRSIIGLGQKVIPFIIDDLKATDNHWFYALEALTGQNPIKENHKGIVPLMKNDWIEWAKANNLTDEN